MVLIDLLFLDRKAEAINFYKLGVEEFLKGLDIKLDEEDQVKLAHIQDKMETNLAMAIDRIDVLGKIMF